MQKLCVKNGRVWEQATLHLKSGIPQFSRHNIAKVIALDLYKREVR